MVISGFLLSIIGTKLGTTGTWVKGFILFISEREKGQDAAARFLPYVLFAVHAPKNCLANLAMPGHLRGCHIPFIGDRL
jgi:hypothetical protein